MSESTAERPIPRSRLSKTPSWITLGFVLGALFVFSLPRQEMKSPPAPPPSVLKLERPALTEIEAVFAEWGHHAVWHNDLTEIALWDTEKRSYSICYEVLRNGEKLYFRSIPRLTRPILTRGMDPQSPLQFTETTEGHREWIEHGQYEPSQDSR
jgi:hypothetical protein